MSARVIVVTGLPGSGKTTLSRLLHDALDLPMLCLDTVKEAVVDGLDPGGELDRFAIRAAAREVVVRLAAEQSRGCILDIWVNPLRDDGEFREALRAISDVRFVELVCRVPAELAIERYAARARHRAHLPADQGTLDRIREAAPHIGPLGLGRALTVDTSRPLAHTDVATVLRWLSSPEAGDASP